MTPRYCYFGRALRHGILWLVLVAGWILAVQPEARAAERALAGSDGRRLMYKDWTVIEDLPDGAERLRREQYRQGEYFRRWKAVHEMVGDHHISRLGQELLAKRGLGPALLADGADPRGKTYDGVDTLRVLIVRISFETNRRPDLTTVDPSGDFVLTPPENLDDLLVDPPPHDRDFYQAHLAGLSEYYNYQSGGRLYIEGTVLPEDPEGSYKLSDPADYGPGAEDFWSLQSLEDMVRDMIVVGDQANLGTEYDFSLHDDNHPFTYIIFVHAGSDWQSDINGDSPNDIPTFFISLGEPQALAGGGMLSECSIIPETTNQDGYPGSIAAAFYHEFGHALGLVDIYDTSTGYPGVGIWDLMDSGTNLPVTLGHITAQNDTIIKSATGVLPPSLAVWNKWFLGWVEMDEVDGREEDYRLPAIQVPRDQYTMWDAGYGDFDLSYPQALRAGASPREYYLIENRFVPPIPDAQGTRTPYERLLFEEDDDTGVILYLAGLRAGVWSNSGMYDYFMPDGGLLVWHVNMDRITPNLHDNTINAWGDGLRLVEADGIQDIGVLDAYVLGWYGSVRDPFNENNGFNAFGPGSNVSSRNFDRSWSGVQLTDIRNAGSRSASVMRFGARVEPLEAGFPWQVESIPAGDDAAAGARALDVAAPVALDYDGNALLVFSDVPGDSNSVEDFDASLYALTAGGDTPFSPVADRPAGAVLALPGPLAGPLVLRPEDQDAANKRLVYGTRDGKVGQAVFSLTADPVALPTTAVSEALAYGPSLGRDADDVWHAVVTTALDTLVYWYPDGAAVTLRRPLPASLICAPRTVPTEGASTLLLAYEDGLSVGTVGSTSSVIYAWVREPAENVRLTAWPTSEGTAYLAFDDEGRLAMDPAPAANPAELPGLDAPLVCDPAVADLDGDGRHDLLLATATHIHAFSQEGVPLTGWPCRLFDLFPLDEDTRLAGPLLVADVTGDSIAEVLVTTSGGHLLGLDAHARLLPELPFKWGDERAAGLALSGDGNGQTLLWMLSAGGYATEPFGRNHVNGRVMATGWGPAPAADAVSSQWLGTLGGPTRSGAVGTPRSLGDDAPLTAEMERALLYPNPIHDSDLTVRFYAHAQAEAMFYLYNLEGEEISRSRFTTTAGAVNEHRVDVSGLVSGMYLARLTYPGSGGTETRTLTLAVER